MTVFTTIMFILCAILVITLLWCVGRQAQQIQVLEKIIEHNEDELTELRRDNQFYKDENKSHRRQINELQGALEASLRQVDEVMNKPKRTTLKGKK